MWTVLLLLNCQKHHNLAKWPAYGVLLRRGIPYGSLPLLDGVNQTAALLRVSNGAAHLKRIAALIERPEIGSLEASSVT